MALKFTTGLRDYMLGKGSARQAFEDCKLIIYPGTAPSSPNSAATGTPLVTLTKSAVNTTLRRGWGEIIKVLVTSDAAAGTWGFTCTVDGGSVTTATYTNTPDAGLAADVAVRLVALFTDIGLRACATGQDGYVYVMGHDNQALTVALAGGMTGTVTITDAQYTQDTNDCLRMTAPSAGAMTKDTSQTWSGVATATGTAGYFRLVTHTDTGGAVATELRVQGSAAAAGGELAMGNVNIVTGQTQTCSTFTLTMAESQ